jgi:hypothetical protein
MIKTVFQVLGTAETNSDRKEFFYDARQNCEFIKTPGSCERALLNFHFHKLKNNIIENKTKVKTFR